MLKRSILCRLLLGTSALLLSADALQAVEDATEQPAAKAQHFAAPSADAVRAQTFRWVATQGNEFAADAGQIAKLWQLNGEPLSARELHQRVLDTIAVVKPEVAEFTSECSLTSAVGAAAEFPALDESDEFATGALRLFFGRHLAQRRMYDEALEQFSHVDPARCLDPATCLFFRSVCEQQLLMKSEGLKSLDLLLSHTEDVPVRYASVARLMRDELEVLRKDTLDEVARMMTDVERRLDLARAGRKVQKREAEVIAALDYMIEKLEQQGGGGSCPCSGKQPGRSNKSNSPAKESQVKGATAPGDVDTRRIAQNAGWGGLPEKEQAAAKQAVDDTFPPHYKKVMDAYFRKLAEREKK